MISNYDIEQYANELWITAKQFEDDLKKKHHTFKIRMAQMKMNYIKQEQFLKEKVQFKFDAYESALTQFKMDIIQIKERTEMQIADYQSYLYNQHMSLEEIQTVLMSEHVSPNQMDDYIKQMQRISLDNWMLFMLPFILRCTFYIIKSKIQLCYST